MLVRYPPSEIQAEPLRQIRPCRLIQNLRSSCFQLRVLLSPRCSVECCSKCSAECSSRCQAECRSGWALTWCRRHRTCKTMNILYSSVNFLCTVGYCCLLFIVLSLCLYCFASSAQVDGHNALQNDSQAPRFQRAGPEALQAAR